MAEDDGDPVRPVRAAAWLQRCAAPLAGHAGGDGLAGSDAVLLAAALIGTVAAGFGGNVAYSWDPEDDLPRRIAAVHLLEMKVAPGAELAAAFHTSRVTLWHWQRALRRIR